MKKIVIYGVIFNLLLCGYLWADRKFRTTLRPGILVEFNEDTTSCNVELADFYVIENENQILLVGDPRSIKAREEIKKYMDQLHYIRNVSAAMSIGNIQIIAITFDKN